MFEEQINVTQAVDLREREFRDKIQALEQHAASLDTQLAKCKTDLAGAAEKMETAEQKAHNAVRDAKKAEENAAKSKAQFDELMTDLKCAMKKQT